MNAPKISKARASADTVTSGRLQLGRDDFQSEDVSLHLSDSPLNRALSVLGDWWTQLILRESFLGVRKYSKFQTHLSIPCQTLSERLKNLVINEIFDDSNGGYRLTPRGLALYPWALMIWQWTRKWGGGLDPRHPARLMHKDCGHVMTPVFACGACREQVTIRDVDYEIMPVSGSGTLIPAVRNKRWTARRALSSPDEISHHIAFITADRWTHLILSAVLLGCRSYGRLSQEVGISTNILAARLALLVESGFLEKKHDPNDRRRYEYSLTPQSRDVYPLTIALVQWANEWLPVDTAPPLIRYHRACEARMHAEVICSHCSGELLPHAVSFQPPTGTKGSRGFSKNRR